MNEAMVQFIRDSIEAEAGTPLEHLTVEQRLSALHLLQAYFSCLMPAE